MFYENMSPECIFPHGPITAINAVMSFLSHASQLVFVQSTIVAVGLSASTTLKSYKEVVFFIGASKIWKNISKPRVEIDF